MMLLSRFSGAVRGTSHVRNLRHQSADLGQATADDDSSKTPLPKVVEEVEKRKSVVSISHKSYSVFTDEEPISRPESHYAPVVLEGADPHELERISPGSPNISELPSLYSSLSKSRLTFLVCLTSSAGYGLAPGSFETLTFAATTLGTALLSCSANTINQIMEVPFDSQMNRTKNRVLVKKSISPLHASGFAVTTVLAGTSLLALSVNGLAATIGLANWVLYTSCYTPMKRISVYNTWVGSIVGALPPLIGWAGSAGTLNLGASIIAGILFAWQFPHFNALSWNLRPDYSKAGYRMASVISPDLCKRVALRYSLSLIGICSAAPLLGVTDWTFAVDSLPLNIYLSVLAYRFYKKSDSSSSRQLFRFTLIHLPLLLTLLFLGKKSKELTAKKSENNIKNIATL